MASWTSTYNGLVSRLKTFVEDDSAEFDDEVQSIVNRAEERVLQDLDITYFDDSRSTSTANGVQTVVKPNGTINVQSIYFTASGAYAQRRTFDWIKAYGGSGRPLYFYEDDTDLYFAPTPDDAYDILIRILSQPTPLSPSVSTNWLTQNVAPLLLQAALAGSEQFLIAPERVAEFEQAYASLLGPARARWREQRAQSYEPVAPTPAPVKER